MENRYLPRTLHGIFDRFSMRTFLSVCSLPAGRQACLERAPISSGRVGGENSFKYKLFPALGYIHEKT